MPTARRGSSKLAAPVTAAVRARGRRSVLDQYLPHFDAVIRGGAVLPARPEEVYAQLRSFDFAQVCEPVGRAIGDMRAVPPWVAKVAGKARRLAPTTRFLLGDAVRSGGILLADAPARHIVLGAVGKLWQADDIPLLEMDRDQFVSFSRPKYVKAVVGFLVLPYGRDRTLLKQECRFLATDSSARAHFRRRWRVVEPFVTFLIRRTLQAVTTTAKEQRAAGAMPPPWRQRPGAARALSFEAAMTSKSQIWDQTIAKSNEWVKELSKELGSENANTILAALRSVLHSLRDRLRPDEAAELAAQLPVLLKGVYFDGWNPSATPVKARTKEQFLTLVLQSLPPGTSHAEAERFTRAVFNLLASHVSSGELRDVQATLPPELRALWPERVAAV